MKLLKLTIAMLMLSSCSSIFKNTENGNSCCSKSKNMSLKKISTLKYRADDKARDIYRHPVETLKFFEIEPQHTVVEINPSAGWYTKIIGPYLKNEGILYLAIFSEASKKTYAKKYNPKIKSLTSNNTFFGNVKYSVLDDSVNTIGPVAPPSTADRVLTFRNFHGWIRSENDEKAIKAFYQALKPGGLLGVVQHRMPEDAEQDKKASTGYVKESYIINLAKKVGFELVAKSEINANSKDTANYKKGVWELPPALRALDSDKAKHLKIGESDRMTLKFKKPN